MSKSFCPLPWINLSTNPIGEVVTCCRAGKLGTAIKEDGEKVLLHRDSITDAINSQSFKEIRLKMLQGKYPKACSDCFFQERSGVESFRQRSLNEFSFALEDAKNITSDDGDIPLELQHIELRPGNTCNLKCVTCNPISSSKWSEDFHTLRDEHNVLFDLDLDGCTKEMFSWAKNESFWKELMNSSSKLKKLYINGGEPTLMPEYRTFLQHLVDQGLSKNIELSYSLNLTVLPREDFPLWKEFKVVKLALSIDDIGERNDYLRFPSNWDQIVENLRELNELEVEMTATQTVSALNFGTLLQLEQWLKRHFPKVKYFHNHLYRPEFLSPMILPPAYRYKVLKTYRIFGNIERAKELEGMYNNAKELPYGRLMFAQYICGIDKIRGTNFETTFPQVAQALGISP